MVVNPRSLSLTAKKECLIQDRVWVRVWESKKRCSCCCSDIRKLSYFFFLFFFFFPFLVIYMYMRVYAYTSTAPYTYACMYVCMLVLYERTIVDSISWPCVLLIRNNVCILFTAYIFFICFRFFFSPMFRHFLVMVNCAGYISLYTIHNIHIICIRYNTCIIYSESIYIYIYLSERVIHRSAVLVDTRVLTLMTNYNCVCTFYIYVQSLTWPNMWSGKTITQNIITSHVMILRGKPSFIDHFCAVCVIKTAIKIRVRIQCSW